MRVILIFLLLLSLGMNVEAEDLPAYDGLSFFGLVGARFVDADRVLGTFSIVRGSVGNIWTHHEWETAAKHIDVAETYFYYGRLNGQKVEVSFTIWLDRTSSQLNPIDRVLDLTVRFDRPIPYDEICFVSTEFARFFKAHPLSKLKNTSFWRDSCQTDLVPFASLAWVADGMVIDPDLDRGTVKGLTLRPYGVAGRAVGLESCFKPAKGQQARCIQGGVITHD